MGQGMGFRAASGRVLISPAIRRCPVQAWSLDLDDRVMLYYYDYFKLNIEYGGISPCDGEYKCTKVEFRTRRCQLK